jgi:uncharacterized protein
VKLRNEFVVAAPLEQTWQALLDVPRVASALPGASVGHGAGGGDFPGRLRLKIGPVVADYTGLARLLDVDEDAHVASFDVQGSGGQGTAAATITSRVTEADGGTRVVVETDLRVTGRAAAFGRGLLEDVSARMLDDFARRLESEILSPAGGASASSDAPTPAREEPLDVGAAAWEPLVRRYAVPALLVLVLLSLLRRPKVIVIRQP